MNKIFKVIFNKSTQTWTVVSELAKSAIKVKSQSSTTKTTTLSSYGKLTLISTLVLSSLYAGMAWGALNQAGVLGSNGDGVAWGADSRAEGDRTVALGFRARASRSSVSIGGDSQALGSRGVAIGQSAEVNGDNGVGIGVNAKALGDSTVAIGAGAKAQSGEAGVAVGNNAQAFATRAAALGAGAQALGASSTAIGHNAQAKRNEASAFGYSARAISEYSLALGSNAEVNGQAGVAIGHRARTENQYGIAIGTEALSRLENSTSIGRKSRALGSAAIAIGYDSSAERSGAIVIGSRSNGLQTKSEGEHSIAIGTGAHVKTNHQKSIAFGYLATVQAGSAIAIGQEAQVLRQEGVALGHLAKVQSQQGIAVGFSAQSTAQSALALGHQANASQEGAVALGSQSVANRKAFTRIPTTAHTQITVNTSQVPTQVYAPQGTTGTEQTNITNTAKNTLGAVSVGGSGKTRQIINVAAGSADSDAANIAQLKAVAKLAQQGASYDITVQGDNGTNQFTINKNKANLTIKGGTTGQGNFSNITVTKAGNDNTLEIKLAQKLGGLDKITTQQLETHNLTVKQKLEVERPATFKQGLTVNNGKTTLVQLEVQDDATFERKATFQAQAEFQGNLEVVGMLNATNLTTLAKQTATGGITLGDSAQGTVAANNKDAVSGGKVHTAIETAKIELKNTGFKVQGKNGTEQTQKLDKKLTITGEDNDNNLTTEALAESDGVKVKIKLNKDLNLDKITVAGNKQSTINNLDAPELSTTIFTLAKNGYAFFNGVAIFSNRALFNEGMTVTNGIDVSGQSKFRDRVEFGKDVTANGTVSANKVMAVEGSFNSLTVNNTIDAVQGVNLNGASGNVAANDHKAVSGDKVYNFVTQQVNNAGFKIDEKGVQKADITSGKVVNFVDGDLTTVSVTQNNGKTEVKYSVVTQEIGSDNQGKAQLQGNRADSKGVAKAVEVVEAVNNASIFLKANEENTGGRVKNGESITVKQGNNIVVERQNSRITVKTVDNPAFKDITTDSLTTSQLETDEARISNAEIDDADINTLTVNEKANISNLTANTAEISEKLTAKTLEVQEKTTLKGEVTAKKGLTVEGDTTFKGKVVFDGEVEIKKMVQDTTTANANITEKLTTKNFEASGEATFKDHVDLQAGATVDGELNVDDVVATGTINANGIKAATADLTQLTVNEKIEAKKGIDLGTGSGEIKDNEKKAVSGEVVARTIKEIKEAGFKVKANGQEHTVKLGETVEFKAGNELTVEQKDGVITYGLTKQIKEAIEAAQKLTNSGVVGGNNKDQTGKEVEGATANGKGSQATGEQSTATGQNAQATGNNATASGANSKATADGATASGAGSQATGEQSTATGQNAQATGNNATASGANSKATADGATASGAGSQATGEQSTATGQNAQATGNNATASGANSKATADGATASGAGSQATGEQSTATGQNAQATGNNATASGA
ncbi:trimeric autotransporter adhesin, partial [Nicoletella semolina]